jgi:D-3-phosphoglycerate dehydrogenase
VSKKDTEKIAAVFADYNVIVSNQEKIADDLYRADIFCGHAKVPVDWPAVVDGGRLRWIQSSAAGLDHCLTPEVIASDIVVSGCSALFANQVAEQTLALLYGAIRRLPVFFRAGSKREFVRRPTDTLHGKTVGIIGFGGNGRRIAELVKDVAGAVLATDLFPEFEVPDYVRCFPADEVNHVCEHSDVVIVTLPLNEFTEKCFGTEQFSRMKPGSYFLNVARGGVVDQSALCTALKDGKLAFACVDVVDPEPLPEKDPLWQFENVMITPHVGAQSEDRVPLTTDLFCLNLPRFVDGQTLINQVDKNLRMPPPQCRVKVSKAGQIVLPQLM